MKEALVRLIDLQKADKAATLAGKKRAEIDSKLKEAEKLLAGVKLEEEAAHKIAQETKAALHRHEMELKEREARITALNGKLGGATSNKEYQSILTEVATIKAENGKIEERILVAMDEVEAKDKLWEAAKAKTRETEGIVRTIGFLTTQIETLRHEQVTIPNAVIVGNVTRNYSRLKDQGGLRVPAKLSIGYDVPWRQVRAMLQLAAERTSNVLRDPPPRILQTALLDHAVEYTMLVTIAEPTLRPLVLTELHANILDAFNEQGVQIMSPVYEADPAAPKVVAREDWFRTPAPPASSP